MQRAFQQKAVFLFDICELNPLRSEIDRQVTEALLFLAHNDSMFHPPTLTARLALSAIGVIGASLISMPSAALSHEEWITAFVRFVDWPAPAPETTLIVCQQQGMPALELDGKQIRGLTLRIRRVNQPRELDGCHLYAALSGSEASWAPWLKVLNQVINVTPPRPHTILAVGQGPQFCELGGAICLVKDATSGVETYRLNLDALARAGFRVGSQLLRSPRSRAAKVVE